VGAPALRPAGPRPAWVNESHRPVEGLMTEVASVGLGGELFDDAAVDSEELPGISTTCVAPASQYSSTWRWISAASPHATNMSIRRSEPPSTLSVSS
jgi:hypothetical protein